MNERDKKTNLKRRQVLYEPIAPYFANTYNTLVSVVQGVALAALFYIFSKEEFNPLIISKCIVAFGVICIIWHRFVVHTQYIAWRLTSIDTLIPMSFAMIQFGLILTIPKTILIFSLVITFIFILGLGAYLNATRQKLGLKELLEEHFMDINNGGFKNEEFAEDLFQELISFNKSARNLMGAFAIFCFIITLAIYFLETICEEVKTYVATALFGIMILILGVYDLRNKFNKSERLKKYPYKW